MHEAGRAIVASLGGIVVAGIRTARVGSVPPDGRAAVCDMAPSPLRAAHRVLRGYEGWRAVREHRRVLRAHACSLLAGDAAEAIFNRETPDFPRGGHCDALEFELHLGALSPAAGRPREAARLMALTVKALRGHWGLVVELAYMLVTRKQVDREYLDELLPRPLRDWPPAPPRRRPAPACDPAK